MDRVDDLGAVDPPQIDRRDAEIGVPELALDDNQRHALVRHLHRVRVTELMRSEPRRTPALAAARASCLRAEDDSQRRPAVTPRITQDSAPTGRRRRTTSHGSNCDHAQRSIPRRLGVRDDLAHFDRL